jgi:RNA polymerase sigma-70 factor (ECF subfamily)
MEATDSELMSRLANGDRAAFGALVERHKRALLAYLGRLSGSRERAEELAQETFVRLFQAAPSYRDQGKLLPYLFRIATNLLRTEERRRTRWRLLQPLVAHAQAQTNGNGNGNGHPNGSHGGEEALLRDELQRRVRREVAQLPLRFRVPLVLFEVEEWSYADIAGLLGCREGTVKSRIHRGRDRLRRALTPYWTEGAR